METPPSVERPSLDAVLSIFFQKDRLGACVYRGRLTALETCESWEHGPLDPPSLSELCSSEHTSVSLIGESYLALQTLLRQVEPTLLLAPARSPESLISILHSYVEGQTCTELPRTY